MKVKNYAVKTTKDEIIIILEKKYIENFSIDKSVLLVSKKRIVSKVVFLFNNINEKIEFCDIDIASIDLILKYKFLKFIIINENKEIEIAFEVNVKLTD